MILWTFSRCNSYGINIQRTKSRNNPECTPTLDFARLEKCLSDSNKKLYEVCSETTILLSNILPIMQLLTIDNNYLGEPLCLSLPGGTDLFIIS